MRNKSKPRTESTAPETMPTDQHDDPVLYVVEEGFEWALDLAVNIAREYPAEVEAIERVRAFMRKRFAGETAHVRLEDLLFTVGLIVASIEPEPGPVAWRMLRLASSLWFPSAMVSDDAVTRRVPVTNFAVPVRGS